VTAAGRAVAHVMAPRRAGTGTGDQGRSMTTVVDLTTAVAG
jgi:hypothetical protein